MTQLSLFDAHPLARSTDPQASHVAASRIERSGRLASNRQAVMDALKAYGPCTSKELAERSGLDRHECGRRLPDLLKLGLVERCGERDGSKETVWLAV